MGKIGMCIRMVLTMILISGGMFVWSQPSLAAITDSDIKNLTDGGGAVANRMNPLIFDMDGDGVGDRGAITSETNSFYQKTTRVFNVSMQPNKDRDFFGNVAWAFVSPIELLILIVVLILPLVFILLVVIRIISRTLIPKWRASEDNWSSSENSPHVS